jgi:hypothetical protein
LVLNWNLLLNGILNGIKASVGLIVVVIIYVDNVIYIVFLWTIESFIYKFLLVVVIVVRLGDGRELLSITLRRFMGMRPGFNPIIVVIGFEGALIEQVL